MDVPTLLFNAAANTLGNLASDGAEVLLNYAIPASTDCRINFEYLKREANWLRARRDDTEQEVRRNRAKATSNYYNQWLDNVKDVLEKVDNVQAAECENVAEIGDEIQKLVELGRFEGGFLVDKPSKPVVKCNPPPPDISKFRTLQEPFEKILSLLRSDREKAIGIWGALGVGKTTIMQHLNDHEEVAKIFDIIIWIKVSRDWNEEKLLRDIKRRLKLNLQDTAHPDEVAESIIEELKDKKYLLLLDDVTDSIDLHRIGIPDNNNGSKVVLTTEFRHVCSSMVNKLVKVNPLSSDEAWMMFQQIVADKINLPDVEPVARQVAEECARLPLLINMVANSFKIKDSVDEWRNDLEELRNWSEVEIQGLTEEHTFIKFCYDKLKDAEKKICLLYVASHPADTKISTEYLVKCWAAGRLFSNIDDRSFRKACDKGYSILRHLSNVSLLHSGKRMEHVRVNNLVRQVALHICSEDLDCKFLIGKPEVSTALNDWEQAKRIFMIDAKLEHLHSTPRCSMLLSLLLQKNTGLKTIPPLFFRTMKKLLVLNLYRTGIKTLPPSFGCLTELKALFLNECDSLTGLPLQIEQLLWLEVLDIRGCNIIFIPPSIGKLVYLRCLKVSYYKPSRQNGYEDMETDYDVISRLSMLEELVIDVASYAQWCIEATDVIQQVASLEKLTSLKIYFPKLEVLHNLLRRRREWQGRRKLTSFWFAVGHPSSDPPEILECFEYKINRYLRYCHDGNDHNSIVSNGFPETDALELIGHDNIRCLLDFMQAPGLNGVRGCLVERCNSMVNIVDGSNASGTDILSILEQMHLRDLPVLSSILEGPLSQGSLSKLHTMVVKSCPMLTKISSDASLGWPQLKELRIYNCPELKRLPFNKENAAELKLIEGEQAWWDALVWENNETKEHFQSIFIPKVSV